MKRLLKLDRSRIVITALLLVGFSIVGVGLVAVTEEGTRARISEAALAVLRAQVSAVLPKGHFNNDPADTAFLLPNPAELNLPPLKPAVQDSTKRLAAATEAGVVGFRASLNGAVTAVVLPVITHYGYSGDIKLIVGVDRDGVVTGVRVTRQNETPGLGDKIEPDKSNWIFSFDGKSLKNPDTKGWAVKKDGGVFDQFTGATITPRAVVGAIHQVLSYVQKHHTELFSSTGAKPKPGSHDQSTSEGSRSTQ
ncbi:MAG: RnfABCDGE type electron transport complex subunit G [Halothiobacillus sp.]|jgi:electron transport complex protein RnfG|nr:RnfABCDGE type electron transport complex subunit G [Halothiobacillus sp.]